MISDRASAPSALLLFAALAAASPAPAGADGVPADPLGKGVEVLR